MIRKSIWVGLLMAIGTVALWPEPAAACGGFMCDGGGVAGPTPVVQAGERVLFEKRQDGTIRAYVQIRYQQGASVGFSWLVPVMGVPELGVADEATFDQLDAASAPQFRFVNSSGSFSGSSGGGGGGGGCGAADGGDFATAERGASEPDTMDDGVQVWNESRVGDYTTAIIAGDDGDAVREWLIAHDYDIPDRASEIIDHYVYTGHRFAAFRYDPLDGVGGSLPPITITYTGTKPCVPIKITAIASVPVLDVMVMTFGEGRAIPDGEYLEVVPDYANIVPAFSTATQTTYYDEVDTAVMAAGGHGWVVEHASSTHMLEGLTDPEAVSLASNNRYVTRFYTRIPQEFMDVDPEFVFTPEHADVNRLHVIDPSALTASAETASSSAPLRFAGVPFGLAGLGLLVRRIRRRQR